PFDENVPVRKIGERLANLRDPIADTRQHVGPAGREVDASRQSQDDAAGFLPGTPLDPLQALEEVRLRGRQLFGSRSACLLLLAQGFKTAALVGGRPTRVFCALALDVELTFQSVQLRLALELRGLLMFGIELRRQGLFTFLGGQAILLPLCEPGFDTLALDTDPRLGLE